MEKKMPQDQLGLSDPYQLIKILNKKIKAQNDSLNWYKKMLQTSDYERKVTFSQLKKKKDLLQSVKMQLNQQKQQRKDSLLQLEQLRTKINKIQKLGLNKTAALKTSYYYSPNSINASKQLLISNTRVMQKPLTSMVSLELKRSDYNAINPMNRMVEQKNKNNNDYVPADVKFFEKNHKSSFFANSSGSFLNMSGDFANQTIHDQPISQNPAQFLFEDFLILGPDVSQLRKKRDQNRKKSQHQIKPAVLFTGNCKNPSQQTYTEIASRCFPFNICAKRQLIENYQSLRHIIQFQPSNKISNDCLIFNLKGQVSNSGRSNICFQKSNLNQIQFIFCLRIPDFVWISKDQKNYQRSQQQIWLVQKYYAIVSYYPYFDIHLNILLKIHKILMQEKLHKILMEKQKFYSFDLRKNMLELQKNQQVKSIISNFKQYRVQYNQVIYFKNHYYGTIPNQGLDTQYCIAKLTAPIFMTNFSFQQMLLLLTALFCQKSIIFISKNEAIATMCALFLINMISPFPYTSFLMLNTDQQKLGPIIFQYPFPMVATIKKTQQNLSKILFLYASARIQKKQIKQQAERIMLVDVDTNSIFYQGGVNFESLIFNPGESIMQEYVKVNGCFSKSFSFPKKMDAKLEPKRRQERQKMMEDMERTITSNTSKFSSFESTKQVDKVLGLLIEYIKSFSLEQQGLQQALRELKSNKYHAVAKKYLLQKHPSKVQLLQKIVNSQFYADYLNLYS